MTEAYTQQLMSSAIGLANLPQQQYGGYVTDPNTGEQVFQPGQRVAGFSAPQMEAFSRIGNVVGGIPQFDEAGNVTGYSGSSYQRPTGQYDEAGQPVMETVTGASAWEPWMQKAGEYAIGGAGTWEQMAPQALGLYGEGAGLAREVAPEAMDLARSGIGAYTATLPETLGAYGEAVGQWEDVAGDVRTRAGGLGTLYDPFATQAQTDIQAAREQAGDVYGEFSKYSPEIQGIYQGMESKFLPAAEASKEYLTGATGRFAREQFDPSSGGIAAYMSPYTQAVKEQAYGDIEEQSQQQLNLIGAQAAEAGAYGGSRHGIAEAEMRKAALEQKSQIGSQLDAANYQQALAASMGEHGAQQTAAQQAYEAQRGGQQMAGQGIANLGSTQVALQAQAAGGLSGLAQTGMGARQGIAGLYSGLGGQASQLGMNTAGLGAQEAGLLSGVGQTGANIWGQYGQQISGLGSTEAALRNRASQQLYSVGSGTANLYGQFGQGVGSLGEAGAGIGQQASAQMAGLGGLTSQYGMQDINALMSAGGMQQNLAQSQLAADYSRFQEQKMDPYQQVGFVSDIFKGVPTSQAKMTSGFAPQPSNVARTVGAATTGIGLFGGGTNASTGSSKPSWS
jgi:hypothetical protein